VTTDTPTAPPLYGVMAEFKTADELIAATKAAAAAGYTRMDGYSPYALGEVADHLGFPRSEIGAVMFIGGVVGATLGFAMQTWIAVYDYPLSIGGKPYWSWPQFIPITWALLVLTASMSGLFGLLALCGLPQPYHPVFNVDRFSRASRDRFFLCIEATDPLFAVSTAKAFLSSLNPDDVAEVPE
jgi:hypothetical protein